MSSVQERSVRLKYMEELCLQQEFTVLEDMDAIAADFIRVQEERHEHVFSLAVKYFDTLLEGSKINRRINKAKFKKRWNMSLEELATQPAAVIITVYKRSMQERRLWDVVNEHVKNSTKMTGEYMIKAPVEELEEEIEEYDEVRKPIDDKRFIQPDVNMIALETAQKFEQLKDKFKPPEKMLPFWKERCPRAYTLSEKRRWVQRYRVTRFIKSSFGKPKKEKRLRPLNNPVFSYNTKDALHKIALSSPPSMKKRKLELDLETEREENLRLLTSSNVIHRKLAKRSGIREIYFTFEEKPTVVNKVTPTVRRASKRLASSELETKMKKVKLE